MLRDFALLAVVILGVSCALGLDTVLLESDAYFVGKSLPQGWKLTGRTPRDNKFELIFAVKQQNTQMLEEILLQVSDPTSTLYGKHLSNDNVHQLLAPDAKHIDSVISFLDSHGITWESATPNSDMITASVSVEQAEHLFDTQYFEFQHASGAVAQRALSYALPPLVAAAVDFVRPTISLPSIRKASVHLDAPNSLFNTPSSLKTLYSVGTTVGKTSVRQAVTAFLEQYYSQSDYEDFQNLLCKHVSCGAGNVILRGDATTGRGGTESMLDIEYITALGANITTEFWGFSGRSPNNKNNEPFIKWLQMMSNTSDSEIPKLFSTSYGEDEDTVSQSYAERLNVEFQKAGARGISLLFASGDSGAAGDNGCDGSNFVPQWPSGSPWVTAVGGTTGSGPESAASLSSGGFSNRWDRPAYQVKAVESYKNNAKDLPPSAKFNSTGRGFPDISAQATSFVVYAGGLPLPGVAGTSCASPTASGVFGLLNDLRAQEGKSSLGFLNPFIYQNADSFNDITQGSNHGCSGGSGFPASLGWDAVTGVGTPNYVKLSNTVKNLP